MRKVIAMLIAFALLLVLSIPVSAAENSQIHELTVLGDSTLVFTMKESPAFWEKPTLKAGESIAASGALIVRNNTDADQNIKLLTVEMPYENEEALRYLNHVYITVYSGSTVLYEGPYSRINDDRHFAINEQVPAHSQIAYTIDLRCDYTYIGEGFSTDDIINWKFHAVQTAVQEEEPASFSDPALLEVLLACIAAGILLSGLFLYDRVRKLRMPKQ